MALETETLPPDEEELTGEEFAEAFSPFHLAHSTLSLNKAYVLQVSAQGSRLAASFSNRQVNVYSAETLTTRTTLRPHDTAITSMAFSKNDEELIFTGSTDGTVKLWDLRLAPDSPPAQVFRDTSDHSRHKGPPSSAEKPILSFDTAPDSRTVCAGTEQVGQDAFLLFWDMRGGALMGGYWESHEDDITCIRFHPSQSKLLSSGSTDGLVNVYDLNEGKEEDALTTCHNTEDSVSGLHWFAKKDNLRYLAISTHTESLQLWDTEHYTPYQHFTRSDVAHGIRRKGEEHCYIVGMHEQEEQGLCLLAGSRCPKNPCLRLATIKNKKIKPMSDLSHGLGSGVVRCSVSLGPNKGFLTGSEDGLVAVWRPGEKDASLPHQDRDALVIKNKKTHQAKPY